MKTTWPLAVLFAVVLGFGAFGLHLVLPFPHQIITGLHLLAVLATGALVLYADEQALLWLRGSKQLLSTRMVNFLHYAVALGLAGIIITGAFLLYRNPPRYFAQGVFLVKMVAVAALIINTYFIDRFSVVATRTSFRALPHRERVPLFISGGVSAAGWLTALLCGLLIG